MGYFKGKQFKKDIILVAVGYYCRFSLSYRDVSEILKERGVSVHPTTIMRWVHEYGKKTYEWRKSCIVLTILFSWNNQFKESETFFIVWYRYTEFLTYTSITATCIAYPIEADNPCAANNTTRSWPLTSGRPACILANRFAPFMACTVLWTIYTLFSFMRWGAINIIRICCLYTSTITHCTRFTSSIIVFR